MLLRYLQSTDEDVFRGLESQLLCEEAAPIIRAVLKQKLRRAPLHEGRCAQNLEDIHGTAVLEVLMRLRELKRNAATAVIDNFDAYVAAITYRVWSEYVRENEPWRAGLKRKLHYLLSREQAFAIWKDADEQWSCGLTSWRNRKNITQNSALRTLLDDPPSCVPLREESGSKHLFEAVSAIFDSLKCPIRFDDLVGTVVSLSRTSHSRIKAGNSRDDKRLDPHPNIAEDVERRILLQYAWTEIGKLPLRQRSALLLNLTDPLGRSVMSLLPATGIASLREIAEALGMSEEQLANIWYELPLDDRTIAGHLGATRQQIINLRKTARERLVRRSRAFRT